MTGPMFMQMSMLGSLLIGLFLLYRSYRRYRHARTYRQALRDTGRNGVLEIAASANVRRAVYSIAIGAVAVLMVVVFWYIEPTGPGSKNPGIAWRGIVIAWGVTTLLVLKTVSGIRDDVDTRRLLNYGMDDTGTALAKEATLVEVQHDVALVSEKVGLAAEAAHAAYEEANSVNQKIAALTKRADVSEERADDAEAREHE